MMKLILFRFILFCFMNLCYHETSHMPVIDAFGYEKICVFSLKQITFKSEVKIETDDIVALVGKVSGNNEDIAKSDIKFLILINIIVTGLVVVLVLFIRLIISKYRLSRLRNKCFLSKHCTQNNENDSLSDKTEQSDQALVLVDQQDQKDMENSESISDTDKQYQQLFTNMQNYLLEDRNYTKCDVNGERLISTLCTNRSTLTRAVRRATNKTPMVYLNYLRLEEAKNLLINNTEYTVEVIAEKCGFNLRTFHRLFINQYRMTPTKYRKVHLPLTY